MMRKALHSSNRPEKRTAILKAATRVFLESGYAGASMDRITREAHVSKATVYSHFENKEDLFGAIVNAECEKLTSVFPAEFGDTGLLETLTELGTRFLDLAMTPQNLSLHRLVVAEAIRFPELGQQFYNQGPKRAIDGLASYLSSQMTKGRLVVADPSIAADHFFALLMGFHHLDALLGINKHPSKTNWQPHIKRVVEMFVRAYAPGNGSIE